jgi:hypothetical protein
MHVASTVRLRLGELSFTWDARKAESNIDKHGITFEEAASTWLDPFAIERPDDTHSEDEDRWLRIGSSVRGALLVVWSTERLSRGRTLVRIIGARRVNRKERTLYEEANEDQQH